MENNVNWTEQRVREEFEERLLPPFLDGKETEENWQARDTSLNNFRRLIPQLVSTRNSHFPVYLKQSYLEHVCQATQSLRSALVSSSCGAISDMAKCGGCELMDQLVDKIIPNLLRLCAQSKKVIVTLASATVHSVLSNSSYSQRLLHSLIDGCLSEKNAQTREKLVEFILEELKKCSGAFPSDLIDRLLSKTLSDSSGGVREKSRLIFKVYDSIKPENAQRLLDSCDLTVKKALKREQQSHSSVNVRSGVTAKVKAPAIPRQPQRRVSDIPVTIFAAPKPQKVEIPVVAVKQKPSPKSVVKLRSVTTPKSLLNARRETISPIPSTSSPVARTVVEKDDVVSNKSGNSRRRHSANLIESSFSMDLPSFRDHSIMKSDIDDFPSSHNYKSSEFDLETTPKASALPAPCTPEPQAPIGTTVKGITGGLVGLRMEEPISLTPLLTSGNNHRQPFNPLEFPATPATPGSTESTTKITKIIQSLRDAAIDGSVAEKTCRRICRFSRSYGSRNSSVLDCRIWSEKFPEMLKLILQLLQVKRIDRIERENLVITLKHCVTFHPDLFGKMDRECIRVLMKIWAEEESNLELAVAVEDCLQVIIQKFEPDVVCASFVDLIKSSNKQQINNSDVLIGNAFRCLSFITQEQRFCCGNSDTGLHLLERRVVVPLFESQLIQKYIISSRILTRMSVYAVLIGIWKVLGDDFIKQYLVPVDSLSPASTTPGKGATPMTGGLKLPCYKLFLTLVEEEKRISTVNNHNKNTNNRKPLLSSSSSAVN